MVSELKMGIAELINNSQLHPLVLEAIFRDVYTEIQALAKHQAKMEEEQWHDEKTKSSFPTTPFE